MSLHLANFWIVLSVNKQAFDQSNERILTALNEFDQIHVFSDKESDAVFFNQPGVTSAEGTVASDISSVLDVQNRKVDL